jgi:hypothetical protein
VEGRKLRFDVAPRAIRKCLATISEHRAENVVVLVQGKLLGDNTVADAGLVAQVKTPKPEPVAAA